MVDGTTVNFTSGSVTVFQDNSGLHSGAILLIEGASIIIYPGADLGFSEGRAK